MGIETGRALVLCIYNGRANARAARASRAARFAEPTIQGVIQVDASTHGGLVGLDDCVTRARALQLLYSGAALVLVPWIVILAIIQPQSGPGSGFRVIVAATSGALIAGTIITLVAWRRGSQATPVFAAAVATATLTTVWFHVVSGTAASVRGATIWSLIVLVPLGLVSGWIAVHTVRPGGAAVRSRIAIGLCAALALLMIIGIGPLVAHTPDRHEASHLKLLWIGLDLAEFTALASTAVTLWRGRRPVLPAACAGALVTCDAWFGLASATERGNALAMAVVELARAAISYRLAWTSAHSALAGPAERAIPTRHPTAG
jgi:hypothetical protein